ncbi:MAG TPA: glycosyltransferase family 39 protein [Candidatus Acidoferrales bacterium]|jgi:Dolichyl-phosphate-mannose-protein mannosyltransferase|nr:glycosyltransferase family 39 protein [Candidatus Acidoferrales bacterium]
MTSLEGAGSAIDRVRARESARASIALLLSLALAKLLIQFAGINHYGFFRDELYYIACGEHLAWGYIDQPPLIALTAWFARHTFGESLFAVRLLPALAGAAVVFLTGWIAREFGGGLFAQFLAALAMLFAPAYLAFDSFLSMNAFEPLFWVLCAWIAIRIVKGASPKLWLAFGAIAGLGLENKHTTLVFGFALVAGLLISGHGRLFCSKWIWIGGAIALAMFLPNLIWEAHNGWPQILVVRNAQEFKNFEIGPLRFLADQILFLQPIELPVWLAGLVWFFAAPEGNRFRFLGWAYLLVMIIFIVLHGKSYYALPIYPILMASGGVALEQLFFVVQRRRWLPSAYCSLIVVAGLITLPFGVPLLPVDTFIRYSEILPYARGVKTERDPTVALPQLYGDMFGWENMASSVGRVYHGLPPQEQSGCAILAGNYGEAGAIDYYGPALGLPKAISGHNNYFLWGPRNYSGDCVIVFGENADRYARLFGEAQMVATITDEHAMPSERGVHVYVCRKPSAPLAILWPNFKMII